MPNSWPEAAANVEKGVVSVGYYFSNVSSLVMRVRPLVFASAPAFSKLGLRVLGQDGARRRVCTRACCHDGADQIHSQHVCVHGQKSQQRPHHPCPMLGVMHPTQVLTLGTSAVAHASATGSWSCPLASLSLHNVPVCSLLAGKSGLPLYGEKYQPALKELLVPLGPEVIP